MDRRIWVMNGIFYADGAMGQLAVGFPEQDMVISLNQTVSNPDANRKMRDVLFGFASKAHESALPEDPEGQASLKKICACLAIAAPEYSPDSPIISDINGRRCRVHDGHVAFFAEDLAIFNKEYQEDVYAFTFRFKQRLLYLTVESESGVHTVCASMDGRRYTNHIEGKIPATELLLNAFWKDSDTLKLEIRWMESCRSRSITFRFDTDGVEMISEVIQVGGFDFEPQMAYAVWEKV